MVRVFFMTLTSDYATDKYTDAKLQRLALEFLENKNLIIEKDKILNGVSGKDFIIAFLIQGKSSSNDRLSTAVIVLDYAKSIGTDVINKYGHIYKDLSHIINKLVIIGNEFSIPARSIAEKTGLLLLSRGELVSLLLTK